MPPGLPWHRGSLRSESSAQAKHSRGVRTQFRRTKSLHTRSPSRRERSRRGRRRQSCPLASCTPPSAPAEFSALAPTPMAGRAHNFGPASAFIVMKSNAGIGGAFYHPPRPLAFQTYRDTPVGVVASDNDPNVAHDKEFIVADQGAASPKKNNVYATWTRFDFNTGAGVGGHSPIYFSQSLDGGATWSSGVEISGASAACAIFSGEANPNACDQDQGSDPIVGSDGTIYVTFGNGNT